MSRIVFLFTNDKSKLIADVKGGRDADTALHGLNHVPAADYLVVHPTALSSLAFVPRLLTYDFVLTQDHLFLGYVVSAVARLLRRKTKWLYFTMTASILVKKHANHFWRLALLKLFWRSYACIICITSEQKKDLIACGVAPRRLVFIPFPIDANFFTKLKATEEDFVVSVGRDAARDYPTLIRAAEHTQEKITIACAPHNIPSGLSIPSNVTVRHDAGLVEVRDLYARCRLVTVVSKNFNEPVGSDCSGQTVILEALAVGKPVIATYRPWIIDYFIPGEDLIVVEPGNPEALAEAITALARDPEKRARLAERGRAKVFAHYTTKIFTASLTRLLETLS